MSSRLIVFYSIAIFLLSSIYFMYNKAMMFDQFQHYYDMKYYNDGKIPYVGARLLATPTIDEASTTPRIPGGIYYILYKFFFNIAQENFINTKIINYIFNVLIIFIFLFWVYKRFNILVFHFLMMILLINPFLISSIIDFWNPNYTLIFSFIFLILLYEYIASYSIVYVKISAILLFPILSIMSQTHINAFLFLVPTLILYFIIDIKKTKIYINYILLGILLSFILYSPYFISEINNNFYNTKLILTTSHSLKRLDFPPIHSLIIFPTNEISIMYGGRLSSIIKFWFSDYVNSFIFIFLIINLSFSIFCFCTSVFYSFKFYSLNSIEEINLTKIMKFLFLFLFINIVMLILLKIKSGPFYYLNSIFSFSFIPIIFVFTKYYNFINSNKLLNNILYIYFIFNMLAVSFQMFKYYNNYERPYNIKNMELLFSKLHCESTNNNNIKIVNIYIGEHKNQYRDISRFFYTNFPINEDDNSTNIYFLFDKLNSYNYKDSYKYNDILLSNSFCIFSNNRLYLYKYTNNNFSF